MRLGMEVKRALPKEGREIEKNNKKIREMTKKSRQNCCR